MAFHKNLITLSILAVVAPAVFADDTTTQQLETLTSQAHPLVQTAADFAVADQVIEQKSLKERAPTIGDALADELGVYSNQYGSGSSRPVIRGQDGPRVKVLQHASETADVSSLSPDHAVTVDPILAKQIEIIRGPSTLLYSAGTVGGLVNVTDQKIPTSMPEKGLEGTAGLRYNSGSDEKLASAGATVALGSQFALRVEGSKREANDYIAPNYFHEHEGELEKERRIGNTFAKGETVSVGGSWIGERGFAGIAYTNRQDQYGLPGHSHEYESCTVSGNLLIGCGEEDYGDEHETGPWVDLKSERYDFRTEILNPLAGFEKLRAHASYTDYQHDEIEGDSVATTFKSKSYDARLEMVHQPIADWEGVVGVQYNQQKLDITGEESILEPTKTQKWSVFGLEHKQWNDFHFELGSRVDHQTIDIESDRKDYDDHAVSYSGAVNWMFAPNYKLSLVGSHQERLPLAQELYADGKHLATNTYERGNENLDVEKSNNLELGFHYDTDKIDYHVHIYHNWYDNYIYAQTAYRYENFRLVDYTQDKARFYGTEAEASYALNDVYKMSVFGDYVRGKIDNENAPRVPAGRLGTKVNANFSNTWSGTAEYYHVFEQDRIASYETETEGYNMVNLGFAYNGQYMQGNDYRVYFKANNLLDETVYSHTSFLSTIPQVGRNFTVGLDFSF
ncbi:zinc piracy TonB-dependent receptor ZnuD [Acinetobacter johnsonii]|uniref:zinc piracy TonB-dependent receptor ZnuD n=1 Tax=Acinetobacter johnsonii TaxID=40214 RepID=UPI00196A9AFE|nr:zinc piracy TonB-dependent receptor ZnuD [Acinetobacter johnsonii]MCU4325233.1 zinc piracy TonB-dependent receptor ZnuD [Acinetobacter johnsonii]QSE46396.1 zinc piracy TonB-dependent receptor ZnuD [Acinetobacter johnsonii]